MKHIKLFENYNQNATININDVNNLMKYITEFFPKMNLLQGLQ